MRKSDFEELPILDKANVTLNTGIELMNRIYIYYQIKLYAIADFYVEIWYQQVSNKIDYVKTVDYDTVAHQYGKDIDITDLFN
jgi:hypothetical protein